MSRLVTEHPTTVRPHPVARVLLRAGLVAPTLLGVEKVRRRLRNAPAAGGLLALEADLLALGFAVGPRLRGFLSDLDSHQLAALGHRLLAETGQLVGAHVPHVPLFRSFPRKVPADTAALWVDRVFSLLIQQPTQPCVLCGVAGSVHPVSPCAHLVCRACWDGSDYSACPICHRRIDLEDPFLTPPPVPPGVAVSAPPRRLVRLELVDDLAGTCRELVARLLGRRTPLTPERRGDLQVLLDHAGPDAPRHLPDDIPVRETRAAVLARFVADPAYADQVPDLLDRYVDTATDVLRLLHALHGGDAGLVTPPARRRSLPRRIRRALLGRLDRLRTASLVDDLCRHRARWLAVAENLHPFEAADRHPSVATAFAALRGTRLDGDTAFGRLVLGVAADHPEVFVRTGDRLGARTWASRVEAAFAADRVLPLLTTRPGELMRRLVALAHRTTDPDALVAAVRDAAPRVGPGVLLAALGAVRAATWPAGTRLFFPGGGSARLWATPDRRPRLSGNLAVALDTVLSGEFLRRAGELPPVGTALLDAGLADLVAPFAERTASTTLVRLPRGSSQPLPDGRVLRLFLHWTEPATTRVDLDLSVALYDTAGDYVGWCDYTRLSFGDGDVLHSGDLTSAPAPLGASEFVDVDPTALRRRGIRWLTMIVFSYNGVPFDAMTDAFAGMMADPAPRGEPFQPGSVEQRFDLTGAVKIATPMVVDLQHGTLRWVDAAMIGDTGRHDVHRHARTIGRLSAAADSYFAAGHRVSLWEVACWHAAARAETVVVRHRDAGRVVYRRDDGESVVSFAARLTALAPGAEPLPEDRPPGVDAVRGAGDGTPGADAGVPGSDAVPGFAALLRGTDDLPEGSQVYALHPGRLDPGRVVRLDAGDLVSSLAPTATSTNS